MWNFIFDLDNTLYDQFIPFKQAFEICFKDTKIDSRQLYERSRFYSDNVFNLTESGELPLVEMHIYRIKSAMSDFNLAITDFEALQFQKSYKKFQQEIKLLDEFENVLNFVCRANLKIGIITNGPKYHQKKKIEQLKLKKWIAKENIIISGEVGQSKPGKEIFKIAENRMKLKPEETYYIGDSFENDVVGAKRAGWKSIWMNHYKKSYNSNILPDYTLTDNKEALELIKKICNAK
ncbi:HAD family hydrolase [Alkalibacterium olivapovliticus]|uniref:Putative hydrolase of the HAD superfamily n=1 Tax=Alkalibacterium olivapovliticus TaxID=99907 RepID=A0A2T0W6R1_9LACT|nr:HAD family hydrolase [Alkalibacterium olivapovliticus]PRY82386.1 putative hydrolase of the HAD superfamily [Alkalibacterium olivapovliticus]